MVLLADGSVVPIEDVKIGDEVVAIDPETGETAAGEVTNLHLNVDTDLTKLTVVGAATGERSVLETTQNHPFWDATTGDWVDASKLKPGHRLLVHDEDRLEGDSSGAGSGGGGPPAEIEVVAVDNHTGSKVMRDLTVAAVHTYHVLAGDEPLLVHNNNGCPDGDPDLFDEFGVTPGQGFNPNVASAGDRSFVTYGFFNAAGEVTYVGRAQGVGTPDRVLAGRIARGHDHYTPDLTPRVLGFQRSYAASRGAEEFFIQGFLRRGANLTNINPALEDLGRRSRHDRVKFRIWVEITVLCGWWLWVRVLCGQAGPGGEGVVFTA